MGGLLERFGYLAVFGLLLWHWVVAAGLGVGLLTFGLLAADGIRSAENRWWPSLQALDLTAPP